MIKKTDGELRTNVMFQLGWDSRVTATDIGVAVKDGVVTLTGTVSSYAEKVAAKEAAHSVLGVLDVANEIEVWVSADARHTDNDIALAVRHALNWDVLVPADKIHSTVTHGQVTLEGNVENFRHRLEAERAVSHLQGVRGLTNKIVVVTPTNPGKVQFLIEELLTVRAEREAGRIRVGVEGGQVTLTGAVKSWDEKKAILGAVSHAPGVTAVHDHLFIAPYDVGFEAALP